MIEDDGKMNLNQCDSDGNQAAEASFVFFYIVELCLRQGTCP